MLKSKVTKIFVGLTSAALSIMMMSSANAQAPNRPGGPGRPGGPAAPGGPRQMMPDSFSFGLGAAIAPRFIGSDNYVANPLPLITWVKNGRTLRNNGFGFEYDVTQGSTFDFGPILRIDTGRDDLNSANDPVIEALGKISLTAELGGFVATTRPLITSRKGPPILWTARASIVQAVSGHEGFIIEGAVGIVRPSRKWITSVTATTSFASGSYQDAYFSVTGAQSIASGLATFDADAGLRDIGVGAFVRYNINSKWSFNTIASFRRLVGDAADSPIVTERGSANQGFLGLNVSYTWR